MTCRKIIAAATLLAALASSVSAQGQLTSFRATSLTGKVATEQALLGQPTVLIVTPSKAAANETRKWAQTLRQALDQSKVAVRDIIAIDLPFFISEQDALSRAREKIPDRYHDQTYLLSESMLEESLNIPQASEDAYVLVLDSGGQVVARVNGAPTEARLSDIVRTSRKLSG